MSRISFDAWCNYTLLFTAWTNNDVVICISVSEYYIINLQTAGIYFMENDTLNCRRSEALYCRFPCCGEILCTFHSEYSISIKLFLPSRHTSL